MSSNAFKWLLRYRPMAKWLATALVTVLLLSPLHLMAFDFTVPLYGGGTFKLSNFRGKVVVVMFASVYCGACKKHMPALASAWRSDPELSSDKYIGLVAMISNYNNPNSAVEQDANFFNSLNPPSNWFLSPEPWDLVIKLGIKYTPTVVIFDPQGNPYAKVVGSDLDTQIKLIKEAAKQGEIRVKLEVKPSYVGMKTEIKGRITGGKVSDLTLVFESPSGKREELTVHVSNGEFSTSVIPSEPGIWTVIASVGEENFTKKFLVKQAYFLLLAGHEVIIFKETDEMSAQLFETGSKKVLKGLSQLPSGKLILLGGPKANGFVKTLNQKLGISVYNEGGRGKIRILDYSADLKVKFGKNDYALLYAVKYGGRTVITVQGLTRYGTFAGALMLQAGYLKGLSYAVIRWADLDGDGSVSFDEIDIIESGIYSFEA